MKNALFTDEEYEVLILKAVEPGATEAQIELFIRECEQMRVGEIILDSILQGHLSVGGYEKNKVRYVKAK